MFRIKCIIRSRTLQAFDKRFKVEQTTDLHIIRNKFSQKVLVIEEAATDKRWNTNLLDQKGRFL